jgi:hypothetical protein
MLMLCPDTPLHAQVNRALHTQTICSKSKGEQRNRRSTCRKHGCLNVGEWLPLPLLLLLASWCCCFCRCCCCCHRCFGTSPRVLLLASAGTAVGGGGAAAADAVSSQGVRHLGSRPRKVVADRLPNIAPILHGDRRPQTLEHLLREARGLNIELLLLLLLLLLLVAAGCCCCRCCQALAVV